MAETITLKSPISKLHGFGKKSVKKANKLGIHTIYDALTYFPFRYNDYQPNNLENEADNATVSLIGTLMAQPEARYSPYSHIGRAEMEVSYDHGLRKTKAVFFRKAWLKYKLKKGQKVLIYGKYNANMKDVIGQTVHTFKGSSNAQLFKPVYSLTKGVKQNDIQKLIKAAYDKCAGQITNLVPKSIRRKYRLEDSKTVIHDMHFPKTAKAERLARRTAKFDDFYHYEVKIQRMKQSHHHCRGIAIHYNKQVLRDFLDKLPFHLTHGQIGSVRDIVNNLSEPTQMNRLLQGDVGSGKTIVAAFGILAAISAHYQAAIMVPTSVLAKQHYKSFTLVFKKLPIRIALLTGDLTTMEKNMALKKIANGSVQLIIGTDALIQPDVIYHKLGLAVIDEQHRFGVDQRKALINKGKGVNALAMTATPIPRTLALTAYGDMDVSVIDSLPKGRKPVKTAWISTDAFHQYGTIQFIKQLLARGQQAYCVVPLVQQKQNEDKDKDKSQLHDPKQQSNEKLDAVTAYQHFKKLFAPYKVGLLHGQMDDDEKDKVMNDFKKGKYSLLVSTTVIEVGVDVANATMMIIYNADNFGLAQLHQLRGRVGRNSMQSYCLLVANPRTKDGKKRMRVMESTDDGFKIANWDLRLRGTGDIFGQSQSGLPHFKVGDPIGDSVILECAQEEARKHTVKRAF